MSKTGKFALTGWFLIFAPLMPVHAGAEAAGVPCLVEPSEEVNVATQVDGVLDEILVDRGDVVSQGQLLAKLNSEVEAAAVEYQSAKTRFAARRYARNEDLQKQQLVSTNDLDEMGTELRMSELDLKQKQEQLNLRRILSPISGIVVDVYKSRGDLVKQEKIIKLANLNPLHVETVLPEQYFGRIRAGQVYSVSLPLLGASYKAKVGRVDRVIDAASSTFRVRLLLPNPRLSIPSGLRCDVGF